MRLLEQVALDKAIYQPAVTRAAEIIASNQAMTEEVRPLRDNLPTN